MSGTGLGPTTLPSVPPVTFVGDPSAEQVVAGLAAFLPMKPDERACLVDRVSRDPLLDSAKRGVERGGPEFRAIERLLERCRLVVTFVPSFVASTNEARGNSLTAAQLQCLSDTAAALSNDDLDSMVEAGVNPKGSLAPQGVQAMSNMLVKCGVS